MADDDQPTTPLPAQDAAAQEGAPSPATTPTVENTTPTVPVAPRQRFTERVWGFRAMIAVALAAVLLGGAGGAALASVSKGGQDGRGPGGFGGHGRGGFGPGMGPGQGHGWGHGRGQGHGQVQPWQDNGGQQQAPGTGQTPAPAPSTTS